MHLGFAVKVDLLAAVSGYPFVICALFENVVVEVFVCPMAVRMGVFWGNANRYVSDRRVKR